MQPAVAVALCDRHDEAQVGRDEVGLGPLGRASPVRMAPSVASSATPRRRLELEASGAKARDHAVHGALGEPNAEQSLDDLVARLGRDLPRAGEDAGALERLGDCPHRAVFIVALVVDRGAGHVAKPELLGREQAPDDGELASAHRGADEARSTRRSPSSMRRARSTSPSRVSSGTRASCSKYVVTASEGESERTGWMGREFTMGSWDTRKARESI